MLSMDEKYLNNMKNIHKMDGIKATHGYSGKENDNCNNSTFMMPLLSEMKLNEKCHCCPYGYHIDLDFVRYCEAYANGSYLRQLKLLKRNRRRQRKSIEAMLNNHEDYSCHPNQLPYKPVDAASGPPPDLVNTSEVLRDALKEAMLDFEETYQKSESCQTEKDDKHCKTISSVNVPSVDLLINTKSALQTSLDGSQVLSESETKAQERPCPYNLHNSSEVFPLSLAGSRSRSGSASSLTSSISTVSSYADHFPVNMPNLPSQQMADTMATFTNSFLTPVSAYSTLDCSDRILNGPPTLTMNRSTLQNIREQMATSLQRMRELEDHVKNIPILQVKLSVLKEEKRLLMLQLKAKNCKLDQRSVGVGGSATSKFDMSVDEMGQRLDQLGAMGITSPRPRRKMLPESRIRSRSESPVFRNKSKLIDLKDFHSHQRAFVISSISPEDEIYSLLERAPKTDLCLRETRSIGVNCSVLTREVGVSHVMTSPKSVAVNVDLQPQSSKPCEDCLQRKNMLNINFVNKSNDILSCLKCSEQEKKVFVETAANVDLPLLKKKNLSRSECKIESFPSYPCLDCLKRQENQVNVSVSTDQLDLPHDACNSELNKKNVKDKFVQYDKICTVNCGINTQSRKTCNSFANTDLYMEDVIPREEYDALINLSTSKSLNLEPEVRDKGIQATKILTKQDKSGQVHLEDFDLTAVSAHSKITRSIGMTTLNPRTIDKGIGGESVLEVICDRCRGLSKNSIGVGNFAVDEVLCDKCTHLHTKTVACGDCKITDILCVKCAKTKVRDIGCGICTVLDEYCRRCSSLKTVSIAVGNIDVNTTVCDNCSQKKSKSIAVGTIQMDQKSIGVNTKEIESTKMEDLAVNTNGNVQICDKCNNAIHSLASDFVQKISPASSVPPPLPSRIPRLTIPSTDSVNTANASIVRSVHVTSKTTASRTSRMSSSKSETQQKSSPSRISYMNKSFEKFLSSRDDFIPGQDTKDATRNNLPTQNALSSDEGDSTDSSDSESSESPDEGSYDGVYGNIVHTCHDDEAIRQGLPGATMFKPISQKSCEKHPINEDLLKACKLLNEQVTTQAQVSTKELNSSLNLIQQEWFRISSQKGASAALVEDYMDAFEDMSHELLGKIVNLSDANGNTAMHYAVSHGNFDVVSLLLDSKVCDVNKQNKAGYTCIMLASLAQMKETSDKSVLQRLFQLGDINVKALQHGQTALMLAVSHGRHDVVKMLLDAGADVNIQDEDGSTALMCASEHGHTEIVRSLLSHPDCDPTLKDNDNCNALTIAMEAGHKDIGVLIYAHTSFSRGSSPLSSLRVKKRSMSSSSTPPSRTPPPPSPASSRKSTKSVP